MNPPTRVGVPSILLLMSAPKNVRSKIQNPKSKICTKRSATYCSKIQNRKFQIRNAKFGAVGASQKALRHNDPKSKLLKIRSEKFGFWRGPRDVPLGNSVTVPRGQRLESSLVPSNVIWASLRWANFSTVNFSVCCIFW